MTEIPPELQDDAELLERSIGRTIIFNAGRNRVRGTLVAFDAEFLKLRVRVESGKEAGLHTLRLGRMGSFVVAADAVPKHPNNGSSVKTKPKA